MTPPLTYSFLVSSPFLFSLALHSTYNIFTLEASTSASPVQSLLFVLRPLCIELFKTYDFTPPAGASTHPATTSSPPDSKRHLHQKINNSPLFTLCFAPGDSIAVSARPATQAALSSSANNCARAKGQPRGFPRTTVAAWKHRRANRDQFEALRNNYYADTRCCLQRRPRPAKHRRRFPFARATDIV
uniref:Secreted protein n=1 Tax=Steinernema glaseri TaxID=37863 RepID=A0A1I7YZ12_9BILA